jgi:hypothetical protein
MFRRRKTNHNSKCVYKFEELCIESNTDLDNLGPIETDCFINFNIEDGNCLNYKYNRFRNIARVDHIGCNELGITGTKILKAVDYISEKLNVKYTELNDASNIEGVPLAWTSLIKYGQTWYERHGYIPENYGEYQFRKNRLLNTVLQHGLTLRQTLFPDLNNLEEIRKFLNYMIDDEDYKYINKSLEKFRKYYRFEDEMNLPCNNKRNDEY